MLMSFSEPTLLFLCGCTFLLIRFVGARVARSGLGATSVTKPLRQTPSAKQIATGVKQRPRIDDRLVVNH